MRDMPQGRIMMDEHDRFEVSFRNPVVRMWFYIVLPTGIISAVLFLVLPRETHDVIRIGGYIILCGFFIWTFIYKRKSKNK